MLSLLSNERLALQYAIRTSVICTCTLVLLVACRLPGHGVRCGDSDAAARGPGCGGSQPTDNSGRWNETDAKKVADEMIGGDMLESAWLQRWHENKDGKRPAVTIHPIRIKTMHHIDEEIFMKDIERHLVNSDKVRFMPFWNNERAQLRCGGGLRCGRTEPPHVKKEKAPEHAAERGADLLVLGAIHSTVQDSIAENKAAIFYTVTLELVNVATNQEAWSSEKEIKKIVKRSKVYP